MDDLLLEPTPADMQWAHDLQKAVEDARTKQSEEVAHIKAALDALDRRIIAMNRACGKQDYATHFQYGFSEDEKRRHDYRRFYTFGRYQLGDKKPSEHIAEVEIGIGRVIC